MTMLVILAKELRSYFSSLIAYVVIAMFLIVAGYSFYTYLVMFLTFVGADLKVGLWQYTFHYLRFAPLTLIPLLTMRLFAEEKKMGTIELLFTAPVRDLDIILGKYCACVLVYALMLGLTLLYPALIGLYFSVAPGPLLACYLGLFLLGAACIACGTFVSSLTENQIVASIVTVAVLLTLWNLDWNEGVAGRQVVAVLHQISLSEHFLNFIKGVIDTDSVVYYLSLVFFFLFLTRCSLAARTWQGLK
jgi:ABC-2 type transport system permease protein